ncbi:MAG TPA: hypothetical protein VGN22_15950 [Pseudonocardia sp.]
MISSPAARYSHIDPTFQIAYRSSVDGGVHTTTVRATNADQAKAEFEMRCAPGAHFLAVRPA